MSQLEDLKEYNAFRVFKELSICKSATRPQLADLTGLTRATIGLIVDTLIEKNLVRESGVASSTGGRPPRLLEYNPDAAFALGAAMSDNQWTIVLTNLGGDIVDKISIELAGNTPRESVDAIAEGVGIIKKKHSGSWILPKIGIGSPGLVDMYTGIVKSAVDIGWFDTPLAEMIHNSTGLTASVMNRSKLGALAEYWYEGRVTKDLIYISLGTGIAAGIIHKGELYIGSTSSAGELGHTTILPDGPLCACGNRGCLQQLVAEAALTRNAREKIRSAPSGILSELVGNHPERLNIQDIFLAERKNDEVVVGILDEAAEYLGIAIANMVNLFNPQKIILGGPISLASSRLCQVITENIKKRAMMYPMSQIRIEQSTLGLDAGAIGAAVLVLQEAADLIFRRSESIENSFR